MIKWPSLGQKPGILSLSDILCQCWRWALQQMKLEALQWPWFPLHELEKEETSPAQRGNAEKKKKNRDDRLKKNPDDESFIPTTCLSLDFLRKLLFPCNTFSLFPPVLWDGFRLLIMKTNIFTYFYHFQLANIFNPRSYFKKLAKQWFNEVHSFKSLQMFLVHKSPCNHLI